VTIGVLLEDYEHLRNDVGAVPLPRDLFHLSGPDTLEYMQGQCSQDLSSLAAGHSVDSLILEPQGKLDALVRLTRDDGDGLYLDVSGGYGERVKARLERFKLRVKVQIESFRWGCLALRGPRASEVLDVTRPPPGTNLVFRFSWNGIEGVDLFGQDPVVPSGVRECSFEALEALRIEAGVPEMGTELDERTIPAEAGLLERCVSFTKGCYTGQELVARLDARGNKVARHLRGVILRSSGTKGEADRGDSVPEVGPGTAVLVGEKTVGSLTSVAWCPGVGMFGALAYLHRSVAPPCPVELLAGGPTSNAAAPHRAPSSDEGAPSTQDEGVRVPAEAVEVPFVPWARTQLNGSP
jgi:folate-binding protein YgfZ